VPVVEDGSESGQSSIRINGQPRYIRAAPTLVLSGAAGTYDAYVTALGEESAAGLSLSALLHPSTTPAKSRRVAEVDWTGTAIGEIRNLVAAVAGHGGLHAFTGPDPIPGIAMPGDLRFTARATVEPGWLACEGQPVSRTTYKALFEAISTTFGAGDGVSTFNVPDYRERSPVGVGGGYTRGLKGGEANHTLSAAEMPSHNHTVTATNAGGAPPLYTDATTAYGTQYPNVGGHDYSIGITTAGAYGWLLGTLGTGGSGAHNNMPPYTVCAVWIKT
jgi:microcystin-dependent protein